MEKKKVSELLVNKLEKYDYSINNRDTINEDEEFFILQDAVITTDEKDRHICVSFHASSDIEQAVILALNLKEISGVKLYVGDTFVFDDEGKYIDGEEALKFHEGKKAQGIIESFVQDQSQKHFLAYSDGYKC